MQSSWTSTKRTSSPRSRASSSQGATFASWSSRVTTISSPASSSRPDRAREREVERRHVRAEGDLVRGGAEELGGDRVRLARPTRRSAGWSRTRRRGSRSTRAGTRRSRRSRSAGPASRPARRGTRSARPGRGSGPGRRRRRTRARSRGLAAPGVEELALPRRVEPGRRHRDADVLLARGRRALGPRERVARRVLERAEAQAGCQRTRDVEPEEPGPVRIDGRREPERQLLERLDAGVDEEALVRPDELGAAPDPGADPLERLAERERLRGARSR